jgi:hypothetical protein
VDQASASNPKSLLSPQISKVRLYVNACPSPLALASLIPYPCVMLQVSVLMKVSKLCNYLVDRFYYLGFDAVISFLLVKRICLKYNHWSKNVEDVSDSAGESASFHNVTVSGEAG